jgi:outer membrane autotransporter protein
MKRVFLLLVFVAAIAAWCSPSFARQIDPGVAVTVNAEGQSNGVDLTLAGAQILTVGAGFPNIGATGGPSVTTTASNLDDIVFNSDLTSTVSGDIGTSGLLIKGIAITGITNVNFNGTVFLGVTDNMEIGAGTVNFNSGTITNAAITNFTGSAITNTINLAPNTWLTGAMTTATENTGILGLNSGSRLVGAATGLRAINVTGGSDIAGVVGTVNGAATNIHSFDLQTNELNITGGILTIFDGGVINTRIASSTVYGHILVEDGYASNLGTGLGINVTVPSTAYIPPGTLFYIVDATSGTEFPDTVTPNNPLYDFSIVTTTAGDATIRTDGIPMQESPDPLVPVLIDIPPTDDLNEVLIPINALTDADAVIDAVAQLAPSTPALAAPLVTFRGTRLFQNLWLSRLDMCSQVSTPDEEKANCRDSEPRNGWWLKGFGYYGEQDARGNSTGYDSRILGTMIAYDEPIGLDTRAGLGFGYARSKIDGKTFDADTDFDTYQAMAFIGHESGSWFINGSVSFGWNEYSSSRHIVFPGVDRTADADYSGQAYTAFASTGFHLSAQEFIITPVASLQYTRMHIDDYTETGAGDIDLKVESQDYDFLESGLGVKVERYFSDRNGMSYVPEGHFNWFHELSNPDLEQTAKFTAAGSSSFTTSGPEAADNLFNVGGGLNLLSCACSATTWSLEAVYDYYWTNEDYSANQLTVRLTSRF